MDAGQARRAYDAATERATAAQNAELLDPHDQETLDAAAERFRAAVQPARDAFVAAVEALDRARQPADPSPELPPAPEDAAAVTVHVAWSRVMADVQAIGKDWSGDLTGRGKQVSFRGVDATMTAFGAAQRRHGVIVRPVAVVPTYRDATTSKGNKMREATVIVTYEITGPRGDAMTAVSVGKALDTGDKATAKAMSVALRTLLLQAGMVADGGAP